MHLCDGGGDYCRAGFRAGDRRCFTQDSLARVTGLPAEGATAGAAEEQEETVPSSRVELQLVVRWETRRDHVLRNERFAKR